LGDDGVCGAVVGALLKKKERTNTEADIKKNVYEAGLGWSETHTHTRAQNWTLSRCAW
jgi:hypothetical protein